MRAGSPRRQSGEIHLSRVRRITIRHPNYKQTSNLRKRATDAARANVGVRGAATVRKREGTGHSTIRCWRSAVRLMPSIFGPRTYFTKGTTAAQSSRRETLCSIAPTWGDDGVAGLTCSVAPAGLARLADDLQPALPQKQ